MLNGGCFVDVDFCQVSKHGQHAAGDVFLSRKLAAEDRLVCVLADGLGSGIKANVLATMTASMALKYVSADIDPQRASEIIMATLPVCSQRRIGYSTFTILDIGHGQDVRIVEYENPPYLLLNRHPVQKRELSVRTAQLGVRQLAFSEFEATIGNRLVVFSDGVSQSGMGSRDMPLGWGAGVNGFAHDLLAENGEISSRQLARRLVKRAQQNDNWKARDDISCAVISFRRPRRTMILTGPPINQERDIEMAMLLRDYQGSRVICGGTTANLVARELGRKVKLDMTAIDPEIPPTSLMDGIDLVTEGTLTLSRLATLLDQGASPEQLQANGAVKLLRLLLESDCIEFIVGTRINESHQDPNLPVELDIRRNLIKRIVRTLNEKYLKEANVKFM